MSVVARDPSRTGELVFAWPEPVPWGSELVCGEDEVAVVCPDWMVIEQLGPGRHAIQPPNPQSHTLAYFVRTTPVSAPFEHMMQVFDRTTGSLATVHYAGAVIIKIGDPLLLCSQFVGVPATDLGGGVLRSASNSVVKALQVMIHKLLHANPSVATLATSDAVTQLVHMTASGNPMAIAVNGVDFLSFERVGVSVDGGTPANAILDEDAIARASSESGHSLELSTDEPFAIGAQVLVYGNDGLWHAGIVHQFRDGGYEVSVDGLNTSTWVEAARVRESS